MEAKEVQETIVLKSRSYARCLREGLAFPFLHIGTILKFSWPFLLLETIVYALLLSSSTDFLFDILAGGGQQAIVWFLFLSLLFLLWGVALETTFWLHLRKWVDLGYLPSVHLGQVWQDWLRMAGRVTLYILGLLLVSLPLALLGMGYLYLWETFRLGAFPATIWAWSGMTALGLLLIMFYLYILALIYQVAMEYLLGQENILDAIRMLRWSKRYVGRTVAVMLLAFLAVCVVVFPFLLPSTLCSYVDLLAFQTILQGDAVDLPGYYSWVRFGAFGLAGFVLFLSQLLLLFPLCLNWGALHQIEKDRRHSAS